LQCNTPAIVELGVKSVPPLGGIAVGHTYPHRSGGANFVLVDKLQKKRMQAKSNALVVVVDIVVKEETEL
jgi:hypothetical protein